MRNWVAIVIAMLLIGGAPAGAQSLSSMGSGLGNPIGSSANLMEHPLQPVVCLGSVGYLYQLCNDVQQAVLAYNTEVRAINQIRAIQEREAQYLRFPDRLQSYVQSDLAQVQQIATQTQQALNWDAQVQKRMNELFANGQTQADTQLDQVLGRLQQESMTYRDQLLRGIGDTSKYAQQGARDQNRADDLMGVAANVHNATEGVQVLTQLTGLLYNAIMRAQGIQSDQLRLDVARAAAKRSQADARAKYSANAAQTAQQVFDPSLPTPAPSPGTP